MSQTQWARLAELPEDFLGPREEDVKVKLVVPLLHILGFTDADMSFETPADLGRVDIAVKGFPVGLIVECKGPRIRLEDCTSQVEKYVRETMTRRHVAMLSILTNGKRFQLFGVLDAIHKNELVDHLLFEFVRIQLKDADIQTQLVGLLSRNSIEKGTVREAVESALRSQQYQRQKRRDEEERAKALIVQKEALLEQIRSLDAELGNLGPIQPPQVSITDLRSTETQASTFKWAKEYGSQEIVCGWINDILERIAPVGSTEYISHPRLTQELSVFLNDRGTERAKSLSKEQRSQYAGNMIDWITAQWTIGLGGKDSPLMRSDPGARVETPTAPDWLRYFTRVWTRKKADKYAFRRR